MDQQNLPIVVAATITAPARAQLTVGQAVGAERWPGSHMWHGEGWGTPWRGVLLAQDDPRAWDGSSIRAKRPGKPTRAEIRCHMAELEALYAKAPAVARGGTREPLFYRVSVLWDFGESGMKIYHEDPANLRPYAEDLAAWEIARTAARAERDAHAALTSTSRAA